MISWRHLKVSVSTFLIIFFFITKYNFFLYYFPVKSNGFEGLQGEDDEWNIKRNKGIQLDTLSASTDIKFTISPAVDDFLAAFESFSVYKKKVMLYEYEVSVIVCSTYYLNTEIKNISVKMMKKMKWKIKRKFPRQLKETWLWITRWPSFK
jgi:hypothetical protein